MQLQPIPNFAIHYHNQTLDLSYPHIMGILNVTPDSFSDGGRYNHVDQALRHTEQMIKDGATIIDVGGESTRPNASPVSEQEEIDRVIKVVEAIERNFGEQVWVSVDTSSPTVMTLASQVGAKIWNDVRALTRPDAIATAAKLDIPVMLMHMRGEPTTMNQLDNYQDLYSDVISELQQRIDKVVAGGVRRDNLIIDPGFGFAKNAQQNLAWLTEFYRLHTFNLPVMVALSRKRFVGEALKSANLPHDPTDRDVASMVAGLFAVQQGACILRTHNVAVTNAGLAMWQATQQAKAS
ncbi:dihydropteroate synthase [Moraxella osloensis]|uniref:Dihydropteroate synthase n=1 Tax=Faucicola osloensis TaxID=34062 RepID=A0A2D2LSV2_FAUOS|nr:dihydropteroate synthase [Moraxella osloensis]ATR78094.1 dihydropteroate synthase [Moraxella osloensis]